MKDLSLQCALEARGDELIGAAMAIWDDRGIRWATLGPRRHGFPEMIDEQTRFPWGSFSKVVTAFIICQLAEEKRLSLDLAIGSLLPEFGQSFPPAARVTVRHLLCHTSGLTDLFEPLRDYRALYERLAEFTLLSQPGELLSYSNAGYALLGAVIRAITGRNWEDEVRKRLIEPLGLQTVAFLSGTPADDVGNAAIDHSIGADGLPIVAPNWPRVGGVLDAAGATLTSGIVDAVHVAAVLMHGRDRLAPSAQPLLGSEMLAEMQRLHAGMPGPSFLAGGWGLGWSYDPVRGQLSHMGGTSVYVLGEPSTGYVGVFLSSIPNGAMVGRELLADALRVDRPIFFPASAPDTNFETVAGRYGEGALSVAIEDRDRQLVADINMLDEAVALSPLSGQSFAIDLPGLRSEASFLGSGAQPTHLHIGLRALARVER